MLFLKELGVLLRPGDMLVLLGVDGGTSPIRKLGKKFEFAPGDAGLEGALPKVIGSI